MKNLLAPKSYGARLTVPNLVTCTGILLLVPYIWCFLAGGNRWIMFGSLFLSGSSDLFDGLLACRLKQATRFGEIIDPLRDRLIGGAVLANMFYLGGKQLAGWITAVIILELLIAAVNYCRREKARVHLAGKLRQAAHLLVGGLSIISYCFGDVIFGLLGFNFVFPGLLALQLMTLASVIALIAYGRLNAD